MAISIKIHSIERLTHDVLKITAGKPANLAFRPGQATDIAINKPGWENEWRTFTFTSLPDDDHIEFNIKTYPTHHGVTNELLSLEPGQEIFIGDVYGDIAYKGEGIFIAGGAGITPFTAIFKYLNKKGEIGSNKLIFANKTQADIIMKDYFSTLLGNNFVNVLSDEKADGFYHGFITAEIIQNQIDGHKYFYLCAPPPMMIATEKILASLGVANDYIIKEGF